MYLWEHLAYLVSSGKLDKELPLERIKELQSFDREIEADLAPYGDDYETYRLETNEAAPLTRAIPGSEPRDMGCIYNRTESVLDVRTPFDEWRGLATLAFCLIAYFTIEFWIELVIQLYQLLNGTLKMGSDSVGGLLFAMTLASLVYGIGTWIFFRYGLRWFRLEVLTQRRMIIRFNRRTRKVWLHRPSSCGGVVALDWDKCFAGTAKRADPNNVTTPINVLTWAQGHGSDISIGVFLGRIFSSDQDSSALWEYIRRFMEEGPQSLPPFTWRERLSKFPWPWRSLYAPWTFFLPLLKRAPGLWFGFILLSPVLLVMGTFHWISLLLCWEPRFPKEAD